MSIYNDGRKVSFSFKSCNFSVPVSPVMSRVPVQKSTPASRHNNRRVVLTGDEYNSDFGEDDET